MEPQHFYLRVNSIKERTTVNGYYVKPPVWDVRADGQDSLRRGSLFYDVKDSTALPRVGSLIHITIDDQTPLTEELPAAMTQGETDSVERVDLPVDLPNDPYVPHHE